MLKGFTYSLLLNAFLMVKERYKNYSMALVFSTNWKKKKKSIVKARQGAGSPLSASLLGGAYLSLVLIFYYLSKFLSSHDRG